MKDRAVTTPDVLKFAEINDGRQFRTLAEGKPFTIRRTRTGVTFDLRPRKGSYLPVNEAHIAEYLACYNASAPEDRFKTKTYRKELWEISYMMRTLAEIGNFADYLVRKKEDEEIEKAPETTREALYLARIGQGQFRDDLLEAQGACYITGIKDPRLLRAAHIKSWSSSSNRERLDKYNGLLLTPTYDHLFDRHFITFTDDGQTIFSKKIEPSITKVLGIDRSARGTPFSDKTKKYLACHRAEFRRKKNN